MAMIIKKKVKPDTVVLKEGGETMPYYGTNILGDGASHGKALAKLMAKAPLTHKGAAVVGNTVKTYKDGSVAEEQEQLGEVLVAEPHATVGVAIGVTRNLGNYESVKISVSLYLPCNNNAEDIEASYHEAKGWVDTRVECINSEIDADLGKKK